MKEREDEEGNCRSNQISWGEGVSIWCEINLAQSDLQQQLGKHGGWICQGL